MTLKKILIYLALVLPLCLSAQNYADYKLYASYDFEQGVIDRQANTSLELKNGARIVEDAVRGKVLYFSGDKCQHAVMVPAPVMGDTMSLSFWYKRSSRDDSKVSWKQIFEFYNSVDGSNIYFMPVYGFDDSLSGVVCDARTFNSGVWEPLYGPCIDANDAWHHVVLVVHETSWSYYLDGEKVGTKNIFVSLSLMNLTHLFFGMNPNRELHPSTGSIDDINIYHYPLSQSQVSQIYAGEAITEPLGEGPLTFHFDNNLNEEGRRITLDGFKYSFVRDGQRGPAVKIDAGGQLNFSDNILSNGSSTINFLYKKESIGATDDGKYIYQASKDDDNSYGIKIKVDGDAAYLVLETVKNGVKNETVSQEKLESDEWNAISIFYSMTAQNNMRIYQNGKQIIVNAGVETYSLGLNQWSLGSTTASKSAGGLYDEFVVENYAMRPDGVNEYYKSNLTSLSITVDFANKHQTIRNFGASDAWDADVLGKYWPEEKKNRLAELLFSKEFDNEGNPKGIGLSCWRFNIGSGSAEQGEESKIAGPSKRTECFMNPDGTYNWEKQKGQQWFLKKAVLDYEVEDIVGFMNSPPVYFTKHGYAFNQENGWDYILVSDKYDNFASFTADVVEHFDKEGIHFDYISPINEPQYQWGPGGDGWAGQEGSPATDQQIADVTKSMSRVFASRKLTTEVSIAEGGAIGSLIAQIPKFWGNEEPDMKVGGLPNVSYVASGHSYWSDRNPEDMYNSRVHLREVMEATDDKLEYFQTEYSLLDGGYTWGHPGGIVGNFREIECAIALARMLHVDLSVGNATGWHWWTAFSQGKHLGESRFALLETMTTKDMTDGFYNDTKLLYTLGQYSRFVRPGMKRVEVNRSDNLSVIAALRNDMYSAYIDEETNQVIIVAANSKITQSRIELAVENLPVSANSGLEFTPYITSDNDDMRAYPKIKEGETFILPPLSIVTFVSESTVPSSITEEPEEINIHIYPNPIVDEATVNSRNTIRNITVYDVYGKVVYQQAGINDNMCKLFLPGFSAGIYIASIETDEGYRIQKIVKK